MVSSLNTRKDQVVENKVAMECKRKPLIETKKIRGGREVVRIRSGLY
jgi:hypothetical protein